MMPVLDDENNVVGVVTEGNMTSMILSGRVSPDSTVKDARVMYQSFHKFTMKHTLSDVAQALDHDPYVLVITEQRCYSGNGKQKSRSVVSGIITRIDLLDYVSSRSEELEKV